MSMAASHTEMGVKVDDGDWSVNRVDGSEQRKDDRMITTKCYNARVIFPIERDRNKFLPGHRVVAQRRISFTVKQSLVSVFDLLNCNFVVIWTNERMNIPKSKVPHDSRHWYIATINNPETCVEGIDLERNIVSTKKPQTTGTCTNSG